MVLSNPGVVRGVRHSIPIKPGRRRTTSPCYAGAVVTVRPDRLQVLWTQCGVARCHVIQPIDGPSAGQAKIGETQLK